MYRVAQKSLSAEKRQGKSGRMLSRRASFKNIRVEAVRKNTAYKFSPFPFSTQPCRQRMVTKRDCVSEWKLGKH